MGNWALVHVPDCSVSLLGDLQKTLSWATCCGCHCLSRRVGPGGLQRSLPISIVLWFCETKSGSKWLINFWIICYSWDNWRTIHSGSVSAVCLIKQNTGYLWNVNSHLHSSNLPPVIPGSSNCVCTSPQYVHTMCPHICECGFTHWYKTPIGTAGVLALCILYPFCSLQPTACGRDSMGSHRYSQVWVLVCGTLWCHPTTWSATAHTLTWGGGFIRPKWRLRWWCNDFCQCYVGVRVLLCYLFYIPRCLPSYKLSCFLFFSNWLFFFFPENTFVILWLQFC